MMPFGAAQAQTPIPLPDVSLWQLFAGDPTFVVMNLVAFAIVAAVLLIVRRRYARFFKIQREALDHRKSADAQALARGESTEQLIARQYGLVNNHNQQIAAQTEEALRISGETLAEIRTMNQNLARIADRLDGITGTAA
jgi:hypothetical protein